MENNTTLFSRVFTHIWENPEISYPLLVNVMHELSHQSSRMDIAEIVITMLEEDVPLFREIDLRADFDVALLVDFLIAWVGKQPLDREYIIQNKNTYLQEEEHTVDFSMRGAIVLRTESQESAERSAREILENIDDEDPRINDLTVFEVEIL